MIGSRLYLTQTYCYLMVIISNLFKTLTRTTTMISTKLLFSSIEVTKQVFYRSPLAFAIVNLKPIVPGREIDEMLARKP